MSGFSVWRLLLVLKGLSQKVTISIESANRETMPTLAMAL
jgi:hypothetical protein